MKNKQLLAIALGAAGLLATAGAQAQSTSSWLLKAGVNRIAPQVSSGDLSAPSLPGSKVVKALNTITASLMVDAGRVAGGDHEALICGDDAEAKAQVTKILREWFGWKRVLDLGDISKARGTESYLALWIRLYGALGTADFNIKVMR